MLERKVWGRKDNTGAFFFFICLEFLVLVPNFRAGRHLPYLWKKKKAGKGRDITREG